MTIELTTIKIKDLVEGYIGEEEDDVYAYGRKLNARPVYQRNFVYNDKEKKAVIHSIMKGYPLNVMYWIENYDGTYDLLDGQQRTLSICEYIAGNYAVEINGNIFEYHNLDEYPDLQEKIDNYELQVYVCRNSTDTEIMEWFEIINIAGKQLTKQEIRNAIYHGTWVSDAKRYFSKNNSPAKNIGNSFIKADWDRQEGLEKVMRWHKEIENIDTIEEYMAKHQKDKDAKELFEYYEAIIDWINKLFKLRENLMKGQDWGRLYNTYSKSGKNYNKSKIEDEIVKLIKDDEVTNQRGIYEYIFDRNEKHLSIRSFEINIKRVVYEKQKGICPHCKNTNNEKKKWKFEEMEADHIKPWTKGGKTIESNCQMLCKEHNRIKSNN